MGEGTENMSPMSKAPRGPHEAQIFVVKEGREVEGEKKLMA